METHQCVTLWCRVLHCDAVKIHQVCCKCVAGCYNVVQRVAMCCSGKRRGNASVWCSVLQCVALCCSVLQCAAVKTIEETR